MYRYVFVQRLHFILIGNGTLLPSTVEVKADGFEFQLEYRPTILGWSDCISGSKNKEPKDYEKWERIATDKKIKNKSN